MTTPVTARMAKGSCGNITAKPTEAARIQAATMTG